VGHCSPNQLLLLYVQYVLLLFFFHYSTLSLSHELSLLSRLGIDHNFHGCIVKCAIYLHGATLVILSKSASASHDTRPSLLPFPKTQPKMYSEALEEANGKRGKHANLPVIRYLVRVLA
jgi:hypothetical protein